MSDKDDTYYVDGDTPVLGYLSECPKCHRKILIETCLCGANHNIGVTAICAECVEIPTEFQKSNPDICDKIKKWSGKDTDAIPEDYGYDGCY